MKVCHFTSAHSPTDDRIYLKECQALRDAGYEVWIVAKGDKNETVENIRFVGCGTPKNRLARLFGFSKKVYKKALALDCDVYHFHDPELLPYGKKLKKKGKKVIFDSHEDVAGQILDKYWIPKAFRKVVSKWYRKYEIRTVRKLDAVVAATPHIATLFGNIAKRTVVVNNYPRLDDIIFQDKPFACRKRVIGYAGGLDVIRGKNIILQAMEQVDGCLILAGKHDVAECKNVTCIGNIGRDGVNELYADSRAGVLLYQPAANHFESQPIKMFEYMAAGLPFVASDFPLWKDILETNECGICVRPDDIEAIRAALTKLLDDPELAERMGRNGRRAVEKRYNWQSEGQKLILLYEGV